MDHLWSPWRFRYVTKATQSDACIFCTKAAEQKDAENFIVHRGKLNFVLLNLYPYTCGHLMIAPYKHVPTMEEAGEEILTEMMQLARRAEVNLRAAYKPDGFNFGMNIGASAGAGVAGHIHWHALPRWTGDANFMSTVGETRVLPEDLPATFEKLVKLTW